jgi:hypothetical protein
MMGRKPKRREDSDSGTELEKVRKNTSSRPSNRAAIEWLDGFFRG